jgi:hypothetical protein
VRTSALRRGQRLAAAFGEDVRLAGELADLERVLAVVRELAVAGARPS